MRFSSTTYRRRTKPQGDFKTPIPESGTLCGEVSHIVYSSEDEAYCVVRIVDGKGKEFMAVGSMPGVAEGQSVELEGKWEINPEHGLQLRVSSCNFSLPVTPEGIMRYLASGIIPGVGPKTAKTIVDKFGAETLNVLDNEPRKLLAIKGFTQKKVNAIRTAWQEHDDKRELRIFLEGLGITPAYFARIYKLYGDSAAQKIRENPYCLASDVRGIGFLLADKIARNAGIGLDDPKRLVAGVSYALEQIRQSGHVCIPRAEFLPKIAEMLEISVEDADRAVVSAVIAGRCVSDFAPDNTEMLYSPLFLRCENELPYLVKKMLIQPFHAGSKLAAVQPELGSQFSGEQLRAVDAVSLSPLSIITGGPGVGKTTVVSEIVRRARALRISVVLAAPTGRAAKRLSEATGENASTIHRLLKWDPVNSSFVHGKDDPVLGQLFVIDEASMLDLPLAVALFRAIPTGSTVVIVGDPDQLPSVGPGNVLNDLIDADICPVTKLTKIFRQGDGSGIILAAHAVNAGVKPELTRTSGEIRDFYWIEKDEPAEAADIILRMITDRIPARFGYDPVRDVQLLCPMNRGECGTIEMNRRLQELLNPGEKPQFLIGDRMFKVGDKVMQIANNYDKNVFNGDMGFLTDIDLGKRAFRVDFDGVSVEYSFDDADQITLAYAVTVHKSQGSEYPVVVMPLLSSHFMMLQRNLLYTGMTRAKKLMILVGSTKAVSMAVRNFVREPRHSLLFTKLQTKVRLP